MVTINKKQELSHFISIRENNEIEIVISYRLTDETSMKPVNSVFPEIRNWGTIDFSNCYAEFMKIIKRNVMRCFGDEAIRLVMDIIKSVSN